MRFRRRDVARRGLGFSRAPRQSFRGRLRFCDFRAACSRPAAGHSSYPRHSLARVSFATRFPLFFFFLLRRFSLYSETLRARVASIFNRAPSSFTRAFRLTFGRRPPGVSATRKTRKEGHPVQRHQRCTYASHPIRGRGAIMQDGPGQVSLSRGSGDCRTPPRRSRHLLQTARGRANEAHTATRHPCGRVDRSSHHTHTCRYILIIIIIIISL